MRLVPVIAMAFGFSVVGCQVKNKEAESGVSYSSSNAYNNKGPLTSGYFNETPTCEDSNSEKIYINNKEGRTHAVRKGHMYFDPVALQTGGELSGIVLKKKFDSFSDGLKGAQKSLSNPQLTSSDIDKLVKGEVINKGHLIDIKLTRVEKEGDYRYYYFNFKHKSAMLDDLEVTRNPIFFVDCKVPLKNKEAKNEGRTQVNHTDRSFNNLNRTERSDYFNNQNRYNNNDRDRIFNDGYNSNNRLYGYNENDCDVEVELDIDFVSSGSNLYPGTMTAKISRLYYSGVKMDTVNLGKNRIKFTEAGTYKIYELDAGFEFRNCRVNQRYPIVIEKDSYGKCRAAISTARVTLDCM